MAHSVAVQLPTFNRLAPSSWFHLTDANFHLLGITQPDTKFWYVVSKLDPENLRKLSSFLAAPRGKDPYTEISAILCQTYEPQLEQKLDALLVTTSMGDERPAEFSLELRRLCDNSKVKDILKRIFVKVIPTCLVDAISGNMDDSFDALTRVGDKALALLANSNMSVSAVSAAGNPVVGELGASVSAVATPSTGQPRGRSSRQHRNRQGRQESKAVVLCPFHLKWGEASRRCLPTSAR